MKIVDIYKTVSSIFLLGLFMSAAHLSEALKAGQAFVIGPAQGITKQLSNKLFDNLNLLSGLFDNYHIFIYSDEVSFNFVSSWAAEDSRISIIRDSYFHSSKTNRLAHGRNKLLDAVKNFRGSQIRRNDVLISMDFDEVNASPLSTATVLGALENMDSWDAVSFNREYYFDIWALRYHRFNVNSWNFGTQSQFLRDLIEADLLSLLNPHQPHFMQVYSAYNGLAIYKWEHIADCRYDGANAEVFAASTVYNHTRLTISEDSEHVALHQCMSAKHSSRIMIYSGIIA